MTDTPPRLRSFAPPTRDKMIIWSAVVAGCGIMALLGRHAAIYRFSTDEFTGNILFARFVKKVFEKPFESTHVRTIEQKLRESKSTKERIPIHTADQMDKLFAHFQRYDNINPSILNKK